MKIAIIGGGVSGLVCAYLLNRRHEITLFEAEDRIGGHTHTVDVERDGRSCAVDTGFIVFNEPAYPNFVKLLARLGVESQPSDMSFSVQCEMTGLEYASHSLDALFARRRNLLRPRFHRMLYDITRFFREARAFLKCGDREQSLADFLAAGRYSPAFIEDHLIPMGSAVWSAEPQRFAQFPAWHFIRFFENHGFLQVRERSPWRVVRGGSREYVRAMTHAFSDRIRLQTPIRSIRRTSDAVIVEPAGHDAAAFDQVVIATHSDQALAMLADASDDERCVLGAIPYQTNETVLHTDVAMLPRARRAWASWNYYRPANERPRATVTYNMNRLQRLDAEGTFCVTLNRENEIAPSAVIRRMTYHHPVYTPATFGAQIQRERISGVNRTHYCGAYWGYGFHEDGVRSALAVCTRFGLEL